MKCRAAAFQDSHGEPAVPGFEFEPQRRARRFKRGLRQTEQHGEHRVAFGGELQAPQFRILIAPGHASTAPQALERSACSVAHSVSFGERVVTMMTCAKIDA